MNPSSGKCVFLLYFSLWMICASAQCPTRDLNAAAAVGRPCRKDCSSDSSQCKDGKVCLCDHECGYSCINLDNFCGIPPTISNAESFRVFRGNRNPVPATSTQFNYDDVAEYICSPGYVKQAPAIPHYCHGRKGWTGSTVCILSCRRYNFRKAREYNLVCGRGCQTDRDCVGNLRCLCDGYCGRSCVNPDIDCGQVTPASNSRISYTGNGFERRVRYTCNPGFYVSSGDFERKCTGGGTWDGDIPSCQRITCGNPLTSIQLMGGGVASGLPGPFYVGHEITIQCSSGRRILGSGKMTCLESGLWSGEDTVCDIIDNEIRCPHPCIPINGRLTQGGNFSVGNFVEFECDPGYVMVGEARQECYYFLEWSGGGSPKCINPKIPQSNDYVIAKLQRATEHSRELLQGAGAGRGSSLSEQSSNLEIYVIIDISEDVRDDSVQSSVKFAEDRILTLSAGGQQVKCAILVYSSNVHISLDLTKSSTSNIISVLRGVSRNRQKLLQNIGYRRNTHLALSRLIEMLQKSFKSSANIDRYVFFLVHGRHDEGEIPVSGMEALKRNHQENLQEVYVISFGNGFQDARSYNELQSLAAPFGRFLPNPNINNLKILSQQNTGTLLNATTCGEAGDIGEIRKLAGIGRIIHGNEANAGAWPWHVVVTIQRSSVFQTYAGGRGGGFRGGGSLINNKWVLTAAHLFNNDAAFQKTGNWEQSILVTFGMHQMPSTASYPLPRYVKVFKADRVIIHPSYMEQLESFDYDIALIKVGRQYNQNGNQWQQTNEGGWLNYTTYIKPVCLPCMENNCAGDHLRSLGIINGGENEDIRCRKQGAWIYQEDDRDDKNILAALTGFGITEQWSKSESLKQAAIKLRAQSRCGEIIPAMIEDGLKSSIQFTDRMMCGVGDIFQRVVDACYGDSGGALVRQVLTQRKKTCWLQLGIVSWGLGCASEFIRDGIKKVYPGYYTKLLPLMPWVKTSIVEAQEKICTRNLTLVEEGRQCRKSCQTDADCRGASKRCRCDDACGMSCFNPDALCLDPEPIENGLFNGGRQYGRSIKYACLSGFDLQGPSKRRCRSDRRWSDSAPLCIEVCIVPEPNSKTIVQPRPFQRLETGERITYTCNDGYQMLDNSYGIVTATCLGRDWSHQPPACVDTKPNFISASFEPGHEIYFLFDLSRDVSDPALNISLTFAVKLVQRLKENSTSPVEYSIFVFASQAKVMLNFTDILTSSSKNVIEILHSIFRDREFLQREIRQGRNIYEVLNSVKSTLTLSRKQHRKNSWKRHILLFVSRDHDMGPSPQSLVTRLSAIANSPMFYVITTCAECLDARVDETRYNEFLHLSQKNVKNVYFVESFYHINDLLDLITDARIDYSVCGKAGDVGSIRQQARLDRIVNGDEAADRSWPWQVVITKFHIKVMDTYEKSNFYGGGSVINNRWVLTAAHLFAYEDIGISDWANDFVVTFGLHKRPTAAAKKLLPIVKIFVPDQIIIHESYANFDFDIALVKIGHQLIPGNERWEEPIFNVGWVNYTEYIRPVCLPCMENNCIDGYLRKYNELDGTESKEQSCMKQSDFLMEANKADKTLLAVVTGFGHTLAEIQEQVHLNARPSTVLRQGLLKIQSSDLCNNIASNHIDWGFSLSIDYTNNMLCAVSGYQHKVVDGCWGDSGGPLVREVHDPDTGNSCWVQVGISSWGWGCGQTYRDLGIEKQIPSYFTNLMRMMPWVKANIAENSAE
ncbi:uncharacterized protein LOC143468237 isoform X2 [Clavelina lepadiformis]|uniref:uncharacterized protein LOC143468237 isoform X2 n=1 Tax=Clavelina lepadiformis TaxID=159417 RepID=UPI0040418113